MAHAPRQRIRTLSDNHGRTQIHSHKHEMAALILAAGDFDESNLSRIGGSDHRGNSKALLSVGNKPQLFHSIKMLEKSGFDKDQIFVTIEEDDLLRYEENERIVPIESRIPNKNMLRVKEPNSSAETLAEGLFKMSQVNDGLPKYILVVYVDILCCGVLRDLAQFNRTTDPAFISVYGPRTHKVSDLKAFPGGEETYKLGHPTKLTFFNGKETFKNIRKLHYVMDTDDIVGDDSFEMPRRILNSSNHLEVVSDLDDQGVFLIRRDVANFIMTTCDDRDSIRGSLIPSIIKRQYTDYNNDGIEKPFECYGIIDKTSTWRLDSLQNYIEAHREIIRANNKSNREESSLQSIALNITERTNGQYRSHRSDPTFRARSIDIDDETVVGENFVRFNEREDFERLEKPGNELSMSKVIIRKSMIGDHCRIEYGINQNSGKSDQNLISIQNSIIMSNVTVQTGSRLNNCILSSGATIGPKCNLVNCIIGPNAVVTGLTKLNDSSIALENDDNDIVIG